MRSLLLPQNLRELVADLTPEQWAALDAFRRGSDRVSFAVRLLNEGLDRAVVRERVMHRFEISRRQAYRVIEEALNARKTVPCDGTPSIYREG